MTTREFIRKTFEGTTKVTQCSSVFSITDFKGDVTVYSYGYHYPLATIIGGKGFVNDRGYSNSTAKHINWAFSALGEVLGNNNVFHAPLLDGDSLNTVGVKNSATKEHKRLMSAMASKKRKDTKVYQWLEAQDNRMVATLKAIKHLQ